MSDLIPEELYCDVENCDHVGVATVNGVRLCRPHQIRRATDALSDVGNALRLFKASVECRAYYNVEDGRIKDGVIEKVAAKHDVDSGELQARLGCETMSEATTDTDGDEDDGAPIAPGETLRINYREPMLVTRAGSSRRYGAWDVEDGEPIGEAWSISETAVRGLMRRYDWTRVDGEALASVRGEKDE